MSFSLSDFCYDLPAGLIAQNPLPQRDASRLLVVDAVRKEMRDSHFSLFAKELKALFPDAKKILLVTNNSKVYPARVRVRRESGGRGEVFVLERKNEGPISCLLRPQKKLNVGEILLAESDGSPVFRIESLDDVKVTCIDPRGLDAVLERCGEMPLPPYIERDPQKVKVERERDKERYQTIFAEPIGSSAAPTAGLHFTPQILQECAKQNIERVSITLHVGLGTFQPVQSQVIAEHTMHSEYYSVPMTTLNALRDAVDARTPIVFVGTTSLRAVESFMRSLAGSSLHEKLSAAKDKVDTWQSTTLFIRPQSVDDRILPIVGNALVTNFHQPESTLVMLVAALCGYSFWREAYQHAVNSQYRFLSYGDSSVIKFRDEEK